VYNIDEPGLDHLGLTLRPELPPLLRLLALPPKEEKVLEYESYEEYDP